MALVPASHPAAPATQQHASEHAHGLAAMSLPAVTLHRNLKPNDQGITVRVCGLSGNVRCNQSKPPHLAAGMSSRRISYGSLSVL